MSNNASTLPSTSELRLEDYGISTFIDANGHEQLRISISTETGAQQTAIFNRSSRAWALEVSRDNKHKSNPPPTRSQEVAISTNRARQLWTDSLPRNENTDWFLNCVDWSTTSLGPLEKWPLSLKTAVSLIMADTHYAAIYWGPSLCSCLNRKAYEEIGKRFNKSMGIQGVPFKECWKEVWSDVAPLFDTMQASAKGFVQANLPVFPQQADGRLEETFWTGSFLPIVGDDGHLAGFYNRALDVTSDVVRERRSNTLYAIAAPPHDKNISVWKHVFRALSENEQDFPMAFAYSADDDPVTCRLTLQQSFGIPPGGHSLVPTYVDVYESSNGFQPYYRKVRSSNQPLVLRKADETISKELLTDFAWKGYGEEPDGIVVMPISVSSRLLGIIVFGLNPRRAFMAEDGAFINSLCRQVSATVAFAIDHEEAQERAKRLTLQLAENERHIREVAEHGPVGMMRVTPEGNMIWANRQYYKITGHPEDDQYEFSFIDVVHPDDRETAASLWVKIVEEHRPMDGEFRVKRTWRPPPTAGNSSPQEEFCWIIANAFPVLENNVLTSVAACVTEISGIKWAERVQSRLASEATEARKLQEAFIDIVSHEMRNPLSAITQLADGIAASLEDWVIGDRSPESAARSLQENVESGRTILLCAAHQKRVIDDVLTLSKLDSQLLSITPVVVQPHAVVTSTLKMFQAEFDSTSMTVNNAVDTSYDELAVDWVLLDPSRLAQVFINLITNAIKFTKNETLRQITIRRSAFIKQRPSLDGVVWFPTKREKLDVTLNPDWGHGEQIYLLFSVSDTGRGLEQKEMMRLFQRFQQATKKTHIKYGGSGLGLFISRELTESMGGEIGVISKPGKGSTFAFYIKARRAPAPDQHDKVQRPEGLPVITRHPSEPLDRFERISRQLSNSLPSLPRPSVLLVEDNVINAQVLMKQLERAGYIVYIANHGVEALDFLPNCKFWHNPVADSPLIEIDCILMDIEMPVLDGLSCTRRIRTLEREGILRQPMTIIAITANARIEQINDAFEAGVNAVLPKPFRVIDLLSKMEEIRAKDPVS